MPPSTSAPSCRTGNAPMAGPGNVVVIEVPSVGGRCPFAPPAPEAPLGGDLEWLCPHQPARSLSLSGPAGVDVLEVPVGGPAKGDALVAAVSERRGRSAWLP